MSPYTWVATGHSMKNQGPDHRVCQNKVCVTTEEHEILLGPGRKAICAICNLLRHRFSSFGTLQTSKRSIFSPNASSMVSAWPDAARQRPSYLQTRSRSTAVKSTFTTNKPHPFPQPIVANTFQDTLALSTILASGEHDIKCQLHHSDILGQRFSRIYVLQTYYHSRGRAMWFTRGASSTGKSRYLPIYTLPVDWAKGLFPAREDCIANGVDWGEVNRIAKGFAIMYEDHQSTFYPLRLACLHIPSTQNDMFSVVEGHKDRSLLRKIRSAFRATMHLNPRSMAFPLERHHAPRGLLLPCQLTRR